VSLLADAFPDAARGVPDPPTVPSYVPDPSGESDLDESSYNSEKFSFDDSPSGENDLPDLLESSSESFDKARLENIESQLRNITRESKRREEKLQKELESQSLRKTNQKSITSEEKRKFQEYWQRRATEDDEVDASKSRPTKPELEQQ